jgi:hypothetical protein
MTNHPITPPPELVQQWVLESVTPGEDVCEGIAIRAAQWGAAQELEACCEWMKDQELRKLADKLQYSRRPKPPSLKEQALALIEEHEDGSWQPSRKVWETIRRALKELPND